MSTLTKLASAFTGTSNLPAHVPAIPGLTPTQRWVASTVPGVAGDLVASWDPEVGTNKFNAETTNSKPVIRVDGAVRMLRFNGTIAAMVAEGGTAAGVVNTNIRTVVMVARVWDTKLITAGTNRGLASLGGSALNQYSDRAMGAFYLPSGAVAKAAAASPDGQFRVIQLVADEVANTTELTVDGVTASIPRSGATRFHESIRIGASGSFHGIDVVEVLSFGTALTTGQRATVRTALKTAYPTLLL